MAIVTLSGTHGEFTKIWCLFIYELFRLFNAHFLANHTVN